MHLLYYRKVMEKNIYLEIPVTDNVKSHLDRWKIKNNFFKGLPLKEKPVSETLVTDASMTGWGAHLGHMQVLGVRSRDPTFRHINYLEMIF